MDHEDSSTLEEMVVVGKGKEWEGTRDLRSLECHAKEFVYAPRNQGNIFNKG